MNLKVLAVFAIFSIFAMGCAKQVNVQRYSEYKMCQLHILRAPHISKETLAKVDNQVKSRNLDCSQYQNQIIDEDINKSLSFLEARQDGLQRDIYQKMGRYQCWHEGKNIRCTY